MTAIPPEYAAHWRALFQPEVARQLRMLAGEEETIIQALLAEAIDLLLTKKAKNRIGTGQAPQ